MSRLASQTDFEQGGLYTSYRRFPFFSTRAQTAHTQFPSAIPILVAGCGYGYLVDELINLGLNAWGCDASSYAITKAQAVLPSTSASKILNADCTNSSSMNSVVSAAGLHGKQNFGLCITEDLLTCASSDTEANTMLTTLRGIASVLFHIVTPGQPGDPNILPSAATLLWKTHSQWKTFVGSDKVMNVENGVIL